MTPGEALQQIADWREAGWIVQVTLLPDDIPFIAPGSASEYNPTPDTTLHGTEGYVAIELSWPHNDRDRPVPGIAPIHAMGGSFGEAADGVEEGLEERRQGA